MMSTDSDPLHRTYIQKNPLFGRKVIRFDRIRPSVWDWNLCDVTIIMIDKDPEIKHLTSVASIIYDYQKLEEIPTKVFQKIESLVKLLDASLRVADQQKAIVLRQETLGKIVELLTLSNVIDESTYSPERMKHYAEEYEHYSRQQMEHLTDVIDVHK